MPVKSRKPSPVSYVERVKQSFQRQTVMHTLGMTLKDVKKGECTIAFDYREDLTQQHGFIHAGVVATALDTACGYAAFSMMPEDAAVLSIEFKTNLLRPAKGQSFEARARVVKPGRTITVSEASLYALSDGKEKLVATMTGTMMTVLGRDGIDG